MRKTLADDLADHQRRAIREALRVREIIEKGLSKNITKKRLASRESTTRAIETLVENSEKVQKEYLKITVDDDYRFTTSVKRDMHVPLA